MSLIPGLPHDLGCECLIRVRFIQFPILARVCKAWKYEIPSPEFRSYRKQSCVTQNVILLHESTYDKDKDANICRLKLVDPDTGVSCYIPPFPYFPDRSSFQCYGIASVKSTFVALFCRRFLYNLRCSDRFMKVYVFDLSSWTWREGADMPNADRLLLKWTSDGDHIVYVACEQEFRRGEGFAIMEYDVDKDKWRTLPDDSRCRGNCTLVFHRGKLHALSNPPATRGYPTFDVSAWQWDSHESFLPEGCVSFVAGLSDCDGAWYGYDRTNIFRASGGSSWQPIAMIPGSSDVFRLTMWKNKLMVLYWDYTESQCKLYMLDLKKNQWKSVEIYEKISTWKFISAYYFEI